MRACVRGGKEFIGLGFLKKRVSLTQQLQIIHGGTLDYDVEKWLRMRLVSYRPPFHIIFVLYDFFTCTIK